jgi:hypothetical protein
MASCIAQVKRRDGGADSTLIHSLWRSSFGSRRGQAEARRKLGYFLNHKFSGQSFSALRKLGCRKNKLHKVIVRGWKDGVEEQLVSMV